MRFVRLVPVLTVGVLSLLPASAGAQSATTGAIAGVVRDTSGGVLPGVTVEAASPALIEKVRSVVTDDQGNYKIVDLRPGTYTVTFTLPGFATFKREGLELTTGFTAAANGEMKVGSLEETVVVTGASPVVDIQNVRTQSVHSRETLDALPTSKSITGLGQLTLGVVSATDVGGTVGDATQQISIHGIQGTDMKNKVDGMSVQNNSTVGGGQNKTYAPNVIAMQETTLELGGMSAESETGGIQMNHVPRDGGNTFSLYSALAFTNGDLQSDNITDDLRTRGLQAVPAVKKIYDYGIGFGGPIRRDKVWFFTAHRAWGTDSFPLNTYWNATQNTPFYTPDFNRPAWLGITERDHSFRATWQITPKMKMAMSESYQLNCLRCARGFDENRPASSEAIASFVATGSAAEALNETLNKPLHVAQATLSYPRTNRLLLDVGFAYNYFGKKTPMLPGVTMNTISIRELSTNFVYGGRLGYPGTQAYSEKGQTGNQVNGRASASYVTGSHAFKAGTTYFFGFEHSDRFQQQALSYNFRNQVPVSLTQYTSPLIQDLRTRQFGLFAQDQWTMGRLTLNLGGRIDMFEGIALEANVPAGRFVPARTYPRVGGIPDWKDFSPRVGAAYDVFGNGRTAVKGYFGKYVFSMGIGFTDNNSPQQAISPASDRTWNDVNGNYVPDCELTNFVANGECGSLANARFGQNARTRIDGDEVREGWDARQYNWQGALMLQQELRPGIALNAGYYRTAFGNLTVIDNFAVTPQDFDPYCVTTPVDANLPEGGGQRLCGLYNQNRATFGQVNEEVRKASSFGDENAQIFNGIDIGINARLKNGTMFAGGVSTGRTRTSDCTIVDSPQAGTPGSTTSAPREGFCESVPPWMAGTQFKWNIVYPLMWGIQVSANYQNLPGVPILATRTFTNAEIAPSLGRNLSACPAATGACTATVNIAMIPTSADTQYEDRLQQVDLRVSKGFRVAGVRFRGSFDLYNAFNAATITSRTNMYGPAWGRVTAILPGRLMKVGGTIEF